MRVFALAALAAAGFAGYAVAADPQTQKTDPSLVSPQSSHPGVEGAAGNKNGPAAKDQGSTSSSSTASPNTAASAPPGTNMKQASPGTDPTHDASGIQGAPGNKNGPSAKGSATGGSSGTSGSSGGGTAGASGSGQ